MTISYPVQFFRLCKKKNACIMVKKVIFHNRVYRARARPTQKALKAQRLKECDITQYSTAFMSNTESPLIDDCLLLLQTLFNPYSSKP